MTYAEYKKTWLPAMKSTPENIAKNKPEKELTPYEKYKQKYVPASQEKTIKTATESNQQTSTQSYRLEGYTDELGKAGYAAYQADKEAKLKKKNEDETFWDKLARWYSGGINDTTLPMTTASVVRDANRNGIGADLNNHPSADWSDDQRNIFGYLYSRSPEEAYSYARDTNEQVTKQVKESQISNIQESATSGVLPGAAHTVGSILTSSLGLADYLNAAIQMDTGIEKESRSITPFEYSQAVTDSITEDLNKTYGTLDESIPVIGGKGWGDVYGLGTGIAQSVLTANTQGPLGSAIVFFGSAAASGVNEAKQQGATEEQAVIYGTLSGLAEAAAEAFSVEKLLKNSIPPNSLKRFFKNVLRQAGVEASEEGVTSLLNNFADQLVLRDKSKFNIRIKQNIEQGMSESAAKTKAWKQLFNDLLYDMLGGFVSGGVSVGIETGFKTASSVAVDITPYADYDNITNQGGTVNANTQHQGGSLHSGGIQRNAQGDTQGQAARGTANGGRNVRSGNQSGLYGENGKRNVHTSDSEGRTLSPQQRSELQGTAVTDNTGAPLALYHATDNMEFTTFEKGDTGFHFGSAEQAEKHSKNRNYSTGRTFRAYLNIKNPVQMNRDIMGWHPGGTALRLWGDGVLTDAEKNDITDLYKIGDGYDSASAVLLRKILEGKGYDGIAYPNGFEGDGTSYIAFHDSQIIKTDINTFGATDTLTGRETLAQAVNSVDVNLLAPRLRQDVRDYRTHWQKLQTTQSLLQQEQSKLQQLQQANGSAYEIQRTQSNIQKLNQILSREQRTLRLLGEKPALRQLLEKTQTKTVNGEAISAADAADAELLDFFGASGRDDLQAIIKRGTIKTPNGFSCFPDGDPLNNNSQMVAPLSGYYDVAMHGTPTTVCFGTTSANMSARLLANLIRHGEGYNGQKIRLLSCSTGEIVGGSTCFAEELANALGVEVMAPNDVLYISKSGQVWVGDHGNGDFISYAPNQRRRIK